MDRGGLSLAGRAWATLTFDYWLNTEAGYDPFTVHIQDNRGVWHEVFRDSGDDSGLGWQHAALDLGAYAWQTGLTLRFRFDSDGSVVPAAPSGVWVDEILLTAATVNLDFGDAPASYGTLLEDNGPRHEIAGPYFGDFQQPAPAGRPDADADGQPDPRGRGDDLDAQGDDEEGFMPSGLNLILGATLSVKATVRGGGYVSGWVDFNANGRFDHPEELICSGWLNEGDHYIPIRTPADAQLGETFGRFRISTTPDLGPLGFAADGEVEDHRVQISQADWGDAPPPYPTHGDQDGAWALGSFSHAWLGQTVDNEPEARVPPDALGDDLEGTPDDEDGVVFLSALVAGSTATVKLTVRGYDCHSSVLGWIDFDRNGNWDPSEKAVVESFIFPAGGYQTFEREVAFQVPATAQPGRTFARFRLVQGDPADVGPTGYGGMGEVEDYAVVIEPPDITPPEVVEVIGQVEPNEIVVVFSEPMDVATTEDLSHYGLALPGVSILGATVLPGRSERVCLTTSGLLAGADYRLTVTGVRDLAGNPLSPDPTVVGFQCPVVQTSTPGTPDLLEPWDTGRSESDDLTCLDNSDPLRALTFRVAGTLPGALVQLHADGTVIGWAVAQGREIDVQTDGATALSDGPHAITARQQLPGEDESLDSAALTVTVDTQPPTIVEGPVLNGGLPRPGRLDSLQWAFSEELPVGSQCLALHDDTNGAFVDISGAGFDCTGRVAVWDTSGLGIGPAFYTAILAAGGLCDEAGNDLDGDGDGVAGGDCCRQFMVACPGGATLEGVVDHLDYLTVKRYLGGPSDGS